MTDDPMTGVQFLALPPMVVPERPVVLRTQASRAVEEAVARVDRISPKGELSLWRISM